MPMFPPTELVCNNEGVALGRANYAPSEQSECRQTSPYRAFDGLALLLAVVGVFSSAIGLAGTSAGLNTRSS
jgi:hypothetical protein